MANRVVQLQSAFQTIINTLKQNKKVLAVFTFGSIVSGDVWEESDIDLFVVYSSEFETLRDVYSEVLGIPVHTKILHKKVFLDLYENDGQKGFVRNLLNTSKLVYSIDDDIVKAYNQPKYSRDIQVQRNNLIYLGQLLKEIGVCKKYLQNGGLKTSYEILLRVLDSFCKLYLNLNGYAVTKDSLNMVTNLNNEFEAIIDKLFGEAINKETIEATLKFVEDFIDSNINNAAKLILDYLYNKRTFVSSYDVVNSSNFRGFNIKVENILKQLTKKDIILKDSRTFEDSFGNKIFEELVYCVKGIN